MQLIHQLSKFIHSCIPPGRLPCAYPYEYLGNDDVEDSPGFAIIEHLWCPFTCTEQWQARLLGIACIC